MYGVLPPDTTNIFMAWCSSTEIAGILYMIMHGGLWCEIPSLLISVSFQWWKRKQIMPTQHIIPRVDRYIWPCCCDLFWLELLCIVRVSIFRMVSDGEKSVCVHAHVRNPSYPNNFSLNWQIFFQLRWKTISLVNIYFWWFWHGSPIKCYDRSSTELGIQCSILQISIKIYLSNWSNFKVNVCIECKIITQ
jgi:hypothetical protein